MTKGPKLFDGLKPVYKSNLIGDIAQMANGAVSTFGDLRGIVSTQMQNRAEHAKSVMQKTANIARKSTNNSTGQMKSNNTDNLVPGQDFDAALARIAALGKRIEALESQLKSQPDARTPQKQPAVRKAAKKAVKKARLKNN